MSFVKPIAASPVDALTMAADHAPYLARLTRQEADILAAISDEGLDDVWARVIGQVRAVGVGGEIELAMTALRAGKRQAHLVIAAADLSGQWGLERVVEANTEFADAAVLAALEAASASLDLSTEGVFVTALGKMGAGELNYSSDIDVAAFYDPDQFDGGARGPANSAARLIKLMTRLLDEQTADGYVLRTDLRLRPDPSSTPVAVSTRMAELYYESVGQNWERMVWIKARPCAGDLPAAAAFQKMMVPFVWRQHLDYWAINDIYAIKAMINSSADRAALDEPGADVKLGPGGIREIEFFVQTQQLILGGRDPGLRAPGTISALRQLHSAGHVEAADAEAMIVAYKDLRSVEHRIQMRQDQQTHTLPSDEARRSSIAALSGSADLGRFDDQVRRTRAIVHRIYDNLFGTEARQIAATQSGNLVFTGVDPDPGTVYTLSELGFSDPPSIIDQVGQWHRGHVSATRTARGRELLTALLPGLLKDMSDTGDPDEAFARFKRFLEHLPSGVQTLSMLLAEAELRKDLVATLALAPRLAELLGKQPQIVEALLSPIQASGLEIDATHAFDDALDIARRHVRDARFLIGHGLLHGHIAAADAGEAYSDLADRTIRAMTIAAEAETVRRFGPVPGRWCVVALGKLGGRALTAGSDLDLMVIYDADADDAPRWFTRFTQRLITALSAETAEGQLYEVDMRLRPSGRAGPVAVRLASFERYHREESWTWEHMALTRLRPVAERGGLAKDVTSLTQTLLADAPRRSELTQDILDMRERLARDKPGAGLWDLKMGAGGLIDLEFIVQRELLMIEAERPLTPRVSKAINTLRQHGRLSANEAVDLLRAEQVLSALQQIQRLALNGDVEPEYLSEGLRNRLARAVGVGSFGETSEALIAVKQCVLRMRQEKIGALGDESVF